MANYVFVLQINLSKCFGLIVLICDILPGVDIFGAFYVSLLPAFIFTGLLFEEDIGRFKW